MKVPVLVADSSYRALRSARNAGLDTFYGEILSEVTEHHVEFVRFDTVLAVTGNDSHNALVCTDLAHEMDRARTFQLSARGQGEHRRNVSYALQGRQLFDRPMSLDELMQRHYNGWEFQLTRISETYTTETFLESLGEDSLIVALERDDQLLFATNDRPLNPRNGDRVLSYVAADTALGRNETKKSDASEDVEEIEERKEEALGKLEPEVDLTTG
jgi:hypothetical protein